MSGDGGMIETIPLSEARARFSAFYDEAVESGRPVRIHRRGDADAVLMARDQLIAVVGEYVCHVHVLPEEETGGYTLWIESLFTAISVIRRPNIRTSCVSALRRTTRN